MGSFGGLAGGFAKGFAGGYELGLRSRQQNLDEYRYGRAPDDEVEAMPGPGGGSSLPTTQPGTSTETTSSTGGGGGGFTGDEIAWKDATPEQKAFLNTLAGPESGGRYDVIYGGSKFSDFKDHPRKDVRIRTGPNANRTSSAAGKYQFLGSTWDDMAKKHGLTDFSPENQDKAAWYLAAEKVGGEDKLNAILKSGDATQIANLGKSLRGIWTSLPGGIEQGTTTDKFVSSYNKYLSKFAAEPGATAAPASGTGAAGVKDAVAEQGGDPDSPLAGALGDLKEKDDEEGGIETAEAIPVPEAPVTQVAGWDKFAQPWEDQTMFAADGGVIPDKFNAARSFTQMPEPTADAAAVPKPSSSWTPRRVGQASATPTTSAGPTASQLKFRELRAAPVQQPVAAAAPVAAAPNPQLRELNAQKNSLRAQLQRNSGSDSIGIQRSQQRAYNAKIAEIDRQIAALGTPTGFAKGGKIARQPKRFAEGVRRERTMSSRGDDAGQSARDKAARRVTGGSSTALDPDGYWTKPTKPRQRDTPRTRKTSTADPIKTGSTTTPTPQQPKPGRLSDENATRGAIPTPPQPRPGRLSDEYSPDPYGSIAVDPAGGTGGPVIPEDGGAASVVPSASGMPVPLPKGPDATVVSEGYTTDPDFTPMDPAVELERRRSTQPEAYDPRTAIVPAGKDTRPDITAPSYQPPQQQGPPARSVDPNSLWRARDEEYKRKMSPQEALRAGIIDRKGNVVDTSLGNWVRDSLGNYVLDDWGKKQLGYASGGVIPEDPLESDRADAAAYQQPQRPQQEMQRPEPEDRQPTPKLLQDVGAAVKGGLGFLTRTFGLDGGGGAIRTPESSGDIQGGARRLALGEGAASSEEISAIDDKIDPERRMSEGDRHMERMAKTMQWYLMNGRKEDAEGVAASLMQYGSKRFSQLGAMAGAAYKSYQKTGDKNALEDAVGYLEKAYEFIPDGGSFDVLSIDPETGQLMTVRRNADGSEENIEINPDQLPGLLQQVQSGSSYWKEISRLADPEGSRQKDRLAHEDQQARTKRSQELTDRGEERTYDEGQKAKDRAYESGESDRKTKLAAQIAQDAALRQEALLRSRPKDKKGGEIVLEDYKTEYYDYWKAYDAYNEEGGDTPENKAALDTAGSKLFEAVDGDAKALKDLGVEIGEAGFTPQAPAAATGGGDKPPADHPEAQRRKDKNGNPIWAVQTADGKWAEVR